MLDAADKAFLHDSKLINCKYLEVNLHSLSLQVSDRLKNPCMVTNTLFVLLYMNKTYFLIKNMTFICKIDQTILFHRKTVIINSD